MQTERSIAGNLLYEAHRALVEKHTVQHRWFCTGTIRAPDKALVLDEAPDQPIFHYILLSPLTIPLADAGPLGSAVLSTSSSLGAPNAHTHLWSLPSQFAPPQPGDRVGVWVLKTRSDDALDGGPFIEMWVAGIGVAVDIAQ